MRPGSHPKTVTRVEGISSSQPCWNVIIAEHELARDNLGYQTFTQSQTQLVHLSFAHVGRDVQTSAPEPHSSQSQITAIVASASLYPSVSKSHVLELLLRPRVQTGHDTIDLPFGFGAFKCGERVVVPDLAISDINFEPGEIADYRVVDNNEDSFELFQVIFVERAELGRLSLEFVGEGLVGIISFLEVFGDIQAKEQDGTRLGLTQDIVQNLQPGSNEFIIQITCVECCSLGSLLNSAKSTTFGVGKEFIRDLLGLHFQKAVDGCIPGRRERLEEEGYHFGDHCEIGKCEFRGE